MGTSVNQRSPDTSGWKAVGACYRNPNVPVERAAAEIWRAAQNQDQQLFEQLGSESVTQAIRVGTGRLNLGSAAEHIRKINGLKQSSLIGEFAKRALIIKAAGGFPNESIRAILFRQLTDYFVSRDIPGFVGAQYRCKTVAELRAFKERLGKTVAAKVTNIEDRENLASRNWRDAYRMIVKELQAI